MEKSGDGVVGKHKQIAQDWEVEYKPLYEQLRSKKVLTEEIWQESVNSLVSPDGINEEDLEVFQYYGNKRLQKDSGGKINIKARDLAKFRNARKDIVYKEEDQLTLKIVPAERKRSRTPPLEKFKKTIKIKKNSQKNPEKACNKL
ncbi:unnamed protein product [Blepharisma stoltei]|uniref:FAM192A/Fyv6 N-terminal domain-containing protein n=1 Tax=Blepharisma stoltei TaxID=1481888 RepID=A0AAU9JSP4_9CILI|nr:unnamed protein product [Blepharisma stoltei]